MSELNIDHLSMREQYILTMAYSAMAPSGKAWAVDTVNYIVRKADELEPITAQQQESAP